MTRIVLAALLLLLAAPAAAARHEAALVDLGLTQTIKRYHTKPILDLPFAGRSDEVLTRARLRLSLAPEAAAELGGIEILINQEPVATLQPAARLEQTFEIDPKLVGDRNQLTLRLVPLIEGACGDVVAGMWRLIEEGSLETEGSPLPLPNDLSILPLPFFDRAYDRSATIPVVFPTAPTPENVRLAAIFAGWIGVDSGLAVDFPVHIGVLPETHAVVLIDSAAAAEKLGLPAPEGPSIRMVDRPGDEQAHHKLLILAGRNAAELELVVRRLAAGAGTLAGELVYLDAPAPRRPRAPYDAPRWMPADAPLTFGRIAGSQALSHEGLGGGTIPLRFRLAPDLFVWPSEWIDLDLAWTGRVPHGVLPPRLDVEMNGQFVGTLAPLDPAAPLPMRQRLRIHRDTLRGFNELLVHITWPESGMDCGGDAGLDDAEISLLPESSLHVERLRHFARMPDVTSFVHDGYPFTRLADLSETAVVLPAAPLAEEVSTVLSLLAHFGATTGEPGSRISVLDAQSLPQDLDRDLLLVGLASDHPLLRRWSARLPVAFGARGPQLQVPEQTNPLLALLEGRPGQREMERARPVVTQARADAAVMAMESPLAAGRVVVVITAGTAGALPGIPEMSGFAQSRTREGDLLLLGEGSRWTFRIGPTWDRGGIDAWTRLRWFLAGHWIVLVPFLLAGAAAVAWPLRGSLQRRAEARLAGSSAEPAA